MKRMRYIDGMTSKEGGYSRTGSRTPMQWDASTNSGFSSAPREKLYLPIDPDPAHPTVAAQEKDESSLLNMVKKLTRLRQSTPALQSNANIRFIFAEENAYPFAYERSLDGNGVLVILNPSDRETSFWMWTDLNIHRVLLSYNGEAAVRDDRIYVPPCSFTIAELLPSQQE